MIGRVWKDQRVVNEIVSKTVFLNPSSPPFVGLDKLNRMAQQSTLQDSEERRLVELLRAAECERHNAPEEAKSFLVTYLDAHRPRVLPHPWALLVASRLCNADQ